ncbi:alpha/beta hydrolase [Neorhodopirellula lusitana]|uniref:alpha/beta hydrolase n=1 Tax=Neorhodopirellula lusitana TaxID=445327 RepID=UPI00384CB2DD
MKMTQDVTCRSCFVVLWMIALSVSVSADSPPVVKVWPDSPPAWDAPSEPEFDKTDESSRNVAGARLIRLSNVTEVQLHVFESADASGHASPVSVVICPGGGFNILAWDLEGTEVAQQLQAGGVSAAVLKYRVPTGKMKPAWKPVVQDIQRAIALVRAGKVFSNTPKHVGVMGFSAGGKAAAHASVAKERYYDSVDASDKQISAPDFACLGYPAWIVEKDDPTSFRDDLAVDQNSPPMFFVHADNDPHTVMNSVKLFQALHDAGVSSALHVFDGSGHGFGAREDGRADDLWPELFLRWIRDNGWLNEAVSKKVKE